MSATLAIILAGVAAFAASLFAAHRNGRRVERARNAERVGEVVKERVEAEKKLDATIEGAQLRADQAKAENTKRIDKEQGEEPSWADLQAQQKELEAWDDS